LDVISQAKPDKTKKKNGNGDKKSAAKKDGEDGGDKGTSFAQKGTQKGSKKKEQIPLFCYCCGDDHKLTICDKNDSIAKKDWVVYKARALQAHQTSEVDSDVSDESDDESYCSTRSSRSVRSTQSSASRSGSRHPGRSSRADWNGFQRHQFSQELLLLTSRIRS
jgi:hypothetical protein